MKKIIIIASFLVCSQSIFAQLEKGMKNRGISSSFNYNNQSNNINTSSLAIYKTSSYSISPIFNFFLSSKFSFGCSIGYSKSKKKSETNNTKSYYDLYDSSNHIQYQNAHTKDITKGIMVSPFIKYYIPLSDNVFFFLKGGISTTFSQTKHSSSDTNFDLNTTTNVFHKNIDKYKPYKTNSLDFNVGISPGILFMPIEKIGLEFLIGNVISYDYTKQKKVGASNKNSSNGFQFLNINSMSAGTAIYYFF